MLKFNLQRFLTVQRFMGFKKCSKDVKEILLKSKSSFQTFIISHHSVQALVCCSSRLQSFTLGFPFHSKKLPNLVRTMSSEITQVSSNYSFSGYQKVYSHDSKVLGCKMNFAIYLPPLSETQNVPVVYWLSGLTCTEQNFIQKSGFQKYASQKGLIVVAPDTSPRGVNIPGEDDSYDFGSGAGFYVDATEKPWDKNYKMYSYITKELPNIINTNFPVSPSKQSIMGHSMGGHGAIIAALKNPGLYQSVSAFSPICNPSECPWGKKAFSGYLGKDETKWSEYDSTRLVAGYRGPPVEILIDQGSSDQFYVEKQLLPENIVEACKEKADGVRVILNLRENYDHSYFFIASFIEEHISYHAKNLTD